MRRAIKQWQKRPRSAMTKTYIYKTYTKLQSKHPGECNLNIQVRMFRLHLDHLYGILATRRKGIISWSKTFEGAEPPTLSMFCLEITSRSSSCGILATRSYLQYLRKEIVVFPTLLLLPRYLSSPTLIARACPSYGTLASKSYLKVFLRQMSQN